MVSKSGGCGCFVSRGFCWVLCFSFFVWLVGCRFGGFVCFLFCCKCNTTGVVPYHIYSTWARFTCKMHTPASVEFRMECTYIRVKSRPYLFPRDGAGVLKRHMLCLGGGNWAAGDFVEQLTLPLSFLPCCSRIFICILTVI